MLLYLNNMLVIYPYYVMQIYNLVLDMKRNKPFKVIYESYKMLCGTTEMHDLHTLPNLCTRKICIDNI